MRNFDNSVSAKQDFDTVYEVNLYSKYFKLIYPLKITGLFEKLPLCHKNFHGGEKNEGRKSLDRFPSK
jgi:hypothetical protein